MGGSSDVNNSLPTILGIEISKKWLDAHILPDGRSWHVQTDPDSLAEWVKIARRHQPRRHVSHRRPTKHPRSRSRKGEHPSRNRQPLQVRGFAKALGQRAKTDAIDARIIAQFALAMQPKPRQLPDEAQALLGELVARRRQLVGNRVAEQCRLKTTDSKPIRRNIEISVRSLKKLLDKIDHEIDEQIRNSPM